MDADSEEHLSGLVNRSLGCSNHGSGVEPLQGAVEVLEVAVQLGFEGGIQKWFEAGTWCQAGSRKVASQQDRSRRGAFELQLFGGLAEGDDTRGHLAWARGAAESIGGDHNDQVVNGGGN